VKRDQFIRELTKDAKALGLQLVVDKVHGKGSHYVVRLGERFTTIKSGEITPLMARIMRKQLGL
jgi:hypothetical protein